MKNMSHIECSSPYQCCGCGACAAICPVNAIDFQEDTEGFLYPHIKSQCLLCGKCVTVCPFKVEWKKSLTRKYPKVYAAWNNNIKIRRKSSSGGIFAALATNILDDGGHVFGAGFDKKFYLKHIKIDKKEDLIRILGSKYFQSDISLSYNEISCLLKNKKKVLFCGTPCQVAGIRNFLGEHTENILLVDFVCHGVPSAQFFHRYLQFCESQEKMHLIDFKFRLTSGWGYGEERYLQKSNGDIKIKTVSPKLSPYIQCFLRAENFRYSCYTCPFANIDRPGDITICDFWGANRFLSYKEYRYGVSGVIINSDQGEKFWRKILKDITYRSKPLSVLIDHNTNLQSATICPSNRKDFYNRWLKESPDKFLYPHPIPKGKILYLKWKIKTIDFLRYIRIISLTKTLLSKLGIKL